MGSIYGGHRIWRSEESNVVDRRVELVVDELWQGSGQHWELEVDDCG